MKNGFAKGVIAVLIANIINLVFSLVTNFTLPKFLSIDTYAAIKTFTLYLSYAGFLHLGYEDGMYLKYGGKNKEDISFDELAINMSTLRVFQIVISIMITLIGFIIHDLVFISFGLTVTPYNMLYYFKNFFQATGEFKLYGRLLNATTIILFVLNMFLLFVIKETSYVFYIAANVFVYVVAWVFMEGYVRVKSNTHFPILAFSTVHFKECIGSGFFLMLGTFSSILLTSMDRWFVKALMTNAEFAQYSFAVSVENFLNVAITPVTITLYNYFCRNKEHDVVEKVKRYVIIFSCLIVTGVFPAKFIIEHWLQTYMQSSSVIIILCAGRIIFTIVTGIYVNLYKANKMQTKYFVKLVLVIVFGFISNYLFYKALGSMDSFAYATFASALLWLILSLFDFKTHTIVIKEYMYIILEILTFIFAGLLMDSVKGFILYLPLSFLLSFIFFRKDVLDIINKYVLKKKVLLNERFSYCDIEL